MGGRHGPPRGARPPDRAHVRGGRDAGVRAPVDDLRIVESSLDCPTDEAFVRLLDEFKPDVVGIRSIVFFVEELQRLARLTRAHCGAAIVVGGPIVEAWKATLLEKVPEIDVAVKGDGREGLSRACCRDGSSRPRPGSSTATARAWSRTRTRRRSADLDGLPLPAYDLVDLERYRGQLSYAYNHRRQGVLVTSRGCVYSCSFCFRPVGGACGCGARRASSTRSSTSTSGHGIRDFYIVDDIFNVHLKRALEVFDRLSAARLDVRLYFVNGLRADTVTEEFVDRAIAAGAVWFTYAVESASDEIQRLTRKSLEPGQGPAHHRLHAAARASSSTSRRCTASPARPSSRRSRPWTGSASSRRRRCCPTTSACGSSRAATSGSRRWPRASLREQLEASTESCYHDMPAGTPTLSRADMTRIVLQYHRRFGLSNPDRVREAVRTLAGVGYTDEEIAHLYSVLRRKQIGSVAELIGS